MRYFPSGLSLKQHRHYRLHRCSLKQHIGRFFSKDTPKFDPYALMSGVRTISYTVNTLLGLTCETKQYPMLTWSFEQHLVWRDNPNPNTSSIPSFRCTAFLKQLIDHRLCSTSQYMKRYLLKHCQFSLKGGCISVQWSAKLLDRQVLKHIS